MVHDIHCRPRTRLGNTICTHDQLANPAFRNCYLVQTLPLLSTILQVHVDIFGMEADEEGGGGACAVERKGIGRRVILQQTSAL